MKNLNEMKTLELKQLAKDNNVPSWWTLKKNELIAALEEVENIEEVLNAEEDTTIPEDYEATIIDNTLVAVSKTIDISNTEEDDVEEDEALQDDVEEDDVEEDEALQDDVEEDDVEEDEALQDELDEIERQLAVLIARKKVIKAQMKKSKTRSHEKLIEFNGKSQNLSAWAKELGFRNQTLFGRIYEMGWTVEKAFTTPVKSRTKKVESEEA